jgi:hypothetical protein
MIFEETAVRELLICSSPVRATGQCERRLGLDREYTISLLRKTFESGLEVKILVDSCVLEPAFRCWRRGPGKNRATTPREALKSSR